MCIIRIRGGGIIAKQSAICTNVVDGDTFNTNVEVRIRLARVNAPSIGTSEGQKAKALLESLILNKSITYEVVARDTYGRAVAEVWVDSKNVNEAMRDAGYK